MKSDLRAAIAQIAADRNVPREVILATLEKALETAYKKAVGTEALAQDIRIDFSTGDPRVFVRRTVLEDEDIEDDELQINVEEARKIKPTAKVGDVIESDSTPDDFGRIAAQAAKQVIMQGLREAERGQIYEAFADREGDIVNGTITRIDLNKGVYIELEKKTEALMPPSEQVHSEKYRVGQRVKVYLMEVLKNQRGPQLIVSRGHRNLLRRLFELEVPEIFNGTVEIKSIAREPGMRSKVAVAARQPGVDPVGSCVGMRGIRIQTIVKELEGEKIDVLPWDADIARFIANALSPAQVVSVEPSENEKSALVLVPGNQLSLAIGKEGQNARLAAKLTGWRIDIKEAPMGASLLSGGGVSDRERPLSTRRGEDRLSAALDAVRQDERRVDSTDDAFARMAAEFARQEREADAERLASLAFGNGDSRRGSADDEAFRAAARAAFASVDAEAGSPLSSITPPTPINAAISERVVSNDATISYNGYELGPIAPHLIGETVTLQDDGKRMLVFWRDELVRSFRGDEYGGDPAHPGERSAGRPAETRRVRNDGTISYKGHTYGPLNDDLIGETVEMRADSDARELSVYALDGALLDRFDLIEGD